MYHAPCRLPPPSPTIFWTLITGANRGKIRRSKPAKLDSSVRRRQRRRLRRRRDSLKYADRLKYGRTFARIVFYLINTSRICPDPSSSAPSSPLRHKPLLLSPTAALNEFLIYHPLRCQGALGFRCCTRTGGNLCG